MKSILKWMPVLLLVSLFSCTGEKDFFEARRTDEPGVYGYLTPIVEKDAATRATVEPDNGWKYVWEVGDRINIWSNEGTLLIYSVNRVTSSGRAEFTGGGFTLTEGETYYSSHPLIRSTLEDYKSLPTWYDDQVQTANNDARHLAEYTYTYTSSVCTNGNTSFQYHHLSSFLRLIVTLPKALTLTELTITADDDLFALDGTADVTTGVFTPGRMSNSITLTLDDIEVSDKVLKAFMAVAPCAAGTYVIRVKDSDGTEYTSPEISMEAMEVGNAYRFEVEVVEGQDPMICRIGEVGYPSLAAAVAAVPTDGTATTITMLADHEIEGNAGVTIPTGKNVVLDLNGKTITGIFDEPSTAQAIKNLGTLTITDSSTAKTGKLTIEVSDENAGSPTWNEATQTYDKNWASNVIRNDGEMTVVSGSIVNPGNGGACYAIDSYTSSNLTVNGGTIVADRASAIRLFYLNGGSLTITGGIIGSEDSYMGVQVMGTRAAGGVSVNLSGGIYSGRYGVYAGGGNDSWATSQFNISGGVYESSVSFTAAISASNINVSGGEYHTSLESYGTEKFIKAGRFTEDAMFASAGYLAPGYKFVQDGSMYVVVENSDPREAIPLNLVYYYWLNGDGSKDGGEYNFYAPFEGPDPVLMDGEFIELLSNIKLTKDVTYLEECDFGDPIFMGGSFSLLFGDYDIDLNGFAFPIPSGVSIKTDKQTDIFSSADSGYAVVETAISDGDYHYQYSLATAAVQIGDVAYASLADAITAAPAGSTIKLLADYNATGDAMSGGSRQFVINKNLTIDGQGHTITTKQRGFGVGNVNNDVSSNIDVTFKDITIKNTSAGARCIDTRGKIGTLTLDNVTLSTQGASGYTQPLTIGGNQADAATVNITNSTIETNEAGTEYYAIITFNPVNMTISGSTLKGWACIYAKGADGSAGSAGSVFDLDDCNIISTNIYSGDSNAFAAFVKEDDNVTINVTNSDIQINSTGDQYQTIAYDAETFTQGGVYLGDGNTVVLTGMAALCYTNELIITGGTFNIDPAAFVPAGYHTVQDGSVWTVVAD